MGVVLFAGGGTAGHLAPGFALAEALEARGVETLFATPGEPREREWFVGRPQPGVVPAPRLPRSLWTALRFGPHLLRGVGRAGDLLRRERVGCVVALGGWPCVPALLAAKIARVPVVFLVPDAVPGLVVRKLRRLAARIYASVPAAKRALGNDERVAVVGPMLRSDLSRLRRTPERYGLAPDRRTLLVLGGSLGAEALYRRWLAGLEAAARADAGLGERIQVLHSVGSSRVDVAAVYRRLGVRHHVTPFLHDMGSAYGTADLVLARAGANTCAELERTATPAVLVPYPHHADRQQYENARPLVDSGGALGIEEPDLTPARVRDVVALLEDEPALAAMRASLAGAPKPAAVDQSAEDLIRLLGWADLVSVRGDA